MKRVYRFLPFVLLMQLVTLAANAQSPRQYYTNRAIVTSSEDAKGINYLLLHKIYAGTLLDDHHVMGKITAVRGSATGWNRKWTVEVNTASAYNSNRGSIICYNEPASLVTLIYNGENYLAVSIMNTSSLFYFSFTGYARNESLTLVYDDNVSNVQSFTGYDPVTIQGNVGIGTTSTGIHKLAVEGSIGARKVKVNQSGWADFVFEPDYKLPPLHEIESYIKANRHLPGIPTTKEVEKEGLDLGEMNKQLLQKIEELTLYLISLKNEKDNLEKHSREQINEMLKRIEKLEKQ